MPNKTPTPTKQQLKNRFFMVYHNFTSEEMANPETSASIIEALDNIKKALAKAK